MSIPDIFLEQMLLGEKETASDAETRSRLREMEDSNREILARYPADAMKRAIAEKLETTGRSALPFTSGRALPAIRVVAFAAAACFALAFAVLATMQLTRSSGFTGRRLLTERPKGDATRMYVYRQAGDRAEKLDTGDRVAVNDVLQVSYNVAGKRWGFIFSVDGNGVLTQHYPERGTFSALLETTGETALPFSYQLDDAPDFERFIMISAEDSFNAQPVLESILTVSRSADFPAKDLSDVVPAGMTVTDIVLYK